MINLHGGGPAWLAHLPHQESEAVYDCCLLSAIEAAKALDSDDDFRQTRRLSQNVALHPAESPTQPQVGARGQHLLSGLHLVGRVFG